MSTWSSEPSAPPSQLPELIQGMVRDGLGPSEIRRRLHLLLPGIAPRDLEPLLLRRDVARPDTDPLRGQQLSDLQIRLGVEIVAAITQRVQPDPLAALRIPRADLGILDALIEDFDPSGQILRAALGLIAALRRQQPEGAAPELSEALYRRMRRDIELVADMPPGRELHWPAPAQVVSERLGQGDWDRAMAAVGMGVGGPVRPQAEPAHRGTAPQSAAVEVEALDDPGFGLITAPGLGEEDQEEAWESLHDRLAEDLSDVAWKDALVVRYRALPGQPWPPSAWARTGPEGAVVYLSGVGATSTMWPWRGEFFRSGRWREPTDHGMAWNTGPLPIPAAAEQLIEGLRFGRDCSDPNRFRWGVGEAEEGDTPGRRISPGSAGAAPSSPAASVTALQPRGR